jgi:aspartate-semialdehyde dehydrogenase
MKLTLETKKILDRDINLTATAVRVPVKGGHSEAVNIEFENDFDLADGRKVLHEMDGVTLKVNIDTNTYPMPLYAFDKDDVFVGRIRRD